MSFFLIFIFFYFIIIIIFYFIFFFFFFFDIAVNVNKQFLIMLKCQFRVVQISSTLKTQDHESNYCVSVSVYLLSLTMLTDNNDKFFILKIGK